MMCLCTKYHAPSLDDSKIFAFEQKPKFSLMPILYCCLTF